MKINIFSKNALKLFLILLIFASFECNDNPVSTVEASLSTDVETSLGTDFDIKLGQTANFSDDNLSITFKDVADERCPIGLECVWQGGAYITLMIQQNGTTIIDTVQTSKPEKIIRISPGNNFYAFKVKELTPYPVYKAAIIKEKYTLTLNVSQFITYFVNKKRSSDIY